MRLTASRKLTSTRRSTIPACSNWPSLLSSAVIRSVWAFTCALKAESDLADCSPCVIFGSNTDGTDAGFKKKVISPMGMHYLLHLQRKRIWSLKLFVRVPDLATLDDQWQAEQCFARAEHELNRPTISALAAVGRTSVRADQVTSSWYGATGVNMSIPIFNGFLFSVRAHEADYRASALQQQLRDLRDRIAR